MAGDLEVIAFATVPELWRWLDEHHADHPGAWVRLQKTSSNHPSVGFHDLLEAGIAFGWSESTRRSHGPHSYLQKFTPRRRRGTASSRNMAIAERLRSEGRMTEAGLRALGSQLDLLAAKVIRPKTRPCPDDAPASDPMRS